MEKKEGNRSTITLSVTVYPVHKERLSQLCKKIGDTSSSFFRSVIDEKHRLYFGISDKNISNLLNVSEKHGISADDLLSKFLETFDGKNGGAK